MWKALYMHVYIVMWHDSWFPKMAALLVGRKFDLIWFMVSASFSVFHHTFSWRYQSTFWIYFESASRQIDWKLGEEKYKLQNISRFYLSAFLDISDFYIPPCTSGWTLCQLLREVFAIFLWQGRPETTSRGRRFKHQVTGHWPRWGQSQIVWANQEEWFWPDASFYLHPWRRDVHWQRRYNISL